MFSGDLNASAVTLGLRFNGPLAGVIRTGFPCGSLCTFRRGGSLLGGIGLAFELLVDNRNVPALGDLSASFHCLTSSTASLKLAGGLATGASVRRDPTIQACLSNLRAETLRFGSF